MQSLEFIFRKQTARRTRLGLGNDVKHFRILILFQIVLLDHVCKALCTFKEAVLQMVLLHNYRLASLKGSTTFFWKNPTKNLILFLKPKPNPKLYSCLYSKNELELTLNSFIITSLSLPHSHLTSWLERPFHLHAIVMTA